jgi:hypothetical protein
MNKYDDYKEKAHYDSGREDGDGWLRRGLSNAGYGLTRRKMVGGLPP